MLTILNHAKRYQGLSEVRGSKSNPLILDWILRSLSWVEQDDSKTPWCGIFVGRMLFETGYKDQIPKHHYRAVKWLNTGKEISIKEARRGDIVIFWRGKHKSSGKGHVGFLDTDKILHRHISLPIFSGNQNNGTNTSNYDKHKILGIRRLYDINKNVINNHSFIDSIIFKKYHNE